MSKLINGENHLSYEETSKRLGIEKYTVANWVHRGKLHNIALPGTGNKYIPEQEVNAYLTGNKPAIEPSIVEEIPASPLLSTSDIDTIEHLSKPFVEITERNERIADSLKMVFIAWLQTKEQDTREKLLVAFQQAGNALLEDGKVSPNRVQQFANAGINHFDKMLGFSSSEQDKQSMGKIAYEALHSMEMSQAS
jgi:excisionase family DNA binding protein